MTLEAGRKVLEGRLTVLEHSLRQVEDQLSRPNTNPHQANAQKGRVSGLKAEMSFVRGVIAALDAE